MILDRLAKAAQEKCGLTKDQPVLLGVSGGADSLAMMLGLEVLGYDLIIAHVDHSLRPESHLEANFVQSLTESHGWPFFSQKVDVNQFAKGEKQSIEEAARHVRYRFLFDQARQHQCQAVAVAHHADDQVETVLMHFLRGAALDGLSGMTYRRIMPQWDPDIPLVRPLLGIWREEIEAFLKRFDITPCVDLTNFDTTYYRNRLRHELIPELETYNPQIKTAIWRMADVLCEESSYLDDLTKQAFQRCLLDQTDDRIQLGLAQFLEQSKAMKRRVLRLAIEQLKPDLRDVGFEAVELGLNFAENAKSGDEIDLIARLNLAVIKDHLIVKTWEAELPDLWMPLLVESTLETPLSIGNPVHLKHGWRIEASLLDECTEPRLSAVKELGLHEVWLDYDCLSLPLAVRGPQEGERFKPLGLDDHSQSLQDLFVNLKIPAHLRSSWPLVTSGAEIAWVVGLRPSESFKITDETQRVLKLKLAKNAIS